MTTKLPVIQTIRVPRDVDEYAREAAREEAERTGRSVTKADVLRDLMREGMIARVQRGEEAKP